MSPRVVIRLTFFAAAFLLPAIAPAIDTTIDRRTYSPADRSAHFLVFAARPQGSGSGGTSLTGHAFVVWGKESPREAASVQIAYGFYPSSGKGIVPVPGDVADEAVRGSLPQMSDRLIVKVDEGRYDEALDAASRWRTRDYELLWSNCVDFLIDVARAAGLATPPKGSDVLPTAYIAKLAEANR